MTAHFVSKRRIVLVIDPAVRTTESEAYNNLVEIVDELRSFEGVAPLSLRFWLPVRGSHQSLGHFLTAHPEVKGHLAGCLSLGSAANVTDEADHPWMGDYGHWFENFVRPARVPVLGVCFAHQFLAHREGGHVDYASHPTVAGARFHAEGRRQVVVTSRRVRMMLSGINASEWNRRSARAQDLRRGLLALREGRLTERRMEHPMTPDERAARRVADQAPAVFDAWARHWQIVKRLGPHAARDVASSLQPAMGSPEFPLDGLVHGTLPWFTVQTHPERPMTPTSRQFLLNFFLMCGL